MDFTEPGRWHTGAVNTIDAPARDEPVEDSGALGRGPRWFRVLAVLVIAASFSVWAYAYSGLARRDPPDLLAHRTFAVSGEAVCAAALSELDELPDALDAVDEADRARQIRTSTGRFEEMLDDLDALVGGSARDRDIASEWLADWRTLVADRYRYADAIAADPQAQFLVTDTGVGERLDRRITRFATTNQMPSCGAPDDVG